MAKGAHQEMATVAASKVEAVAVIAKTTGLDICPRVRERRELLLPLRPGFTVGIPLLARSLGRQQITGGSGHSRRP